MPLYAIQKLTKLMKISLVQDMVTCLKCLSSKNGISSDHSPEAIILGSFNPDYNKKSITFGAYAKVYIGTTNSTKQRKVGTIALCP